MKKKSHKQKQKDKWELYRLRKKAARMEAKVTDKDIEAQAKREGKTVAQVIVESWNTQ